MIEVTKLDKTAVGEIVLRLALASHQAGHKHIKSTVKDYFLPGDENLEGRFVQDLFTLTVPEIIEKWYGGEDNAAQILFNLHNQK